jgi:hypothetical protein
VATRSSARRRSRKMWTTPGDHEIAEEDGERLFGRPHQLHLRASRSF